MFFVIKKSNILFIITLLFVSIVVLNISLKYENMPTFALPSTGMVVVLDAGHGDIDGGAVGVSGAIEKDINLSVCKKVQSFLERSGTFVVLTRSDDNSIVDKEGKSIRQIKRDDLNLRRDYRDSEMTEIFVSIHMNNFPDEKYSGAQVFYSKNCENSKILGETLQKNLVKHVDNNNKRLAKCTDNSIYILKDNLSPSVIVECGFLSNKKEEMLLKTDEYQEKIAWAIYAGIEEYLINAEK